MAEAEGDTMTDTATVETLTAEVRCLMVGSRQVTLSVAKQLDIIPLKDIRVFGRVKVNVSGTKYGNDRYVIGADPSGDLCMAEYSGLPAYTPWFGKGDTAVIGPVTVCRSVMTDTYEHDTYTLSLEGIRFQIDRAATIPCKGHSYNPGEKCDPVWSATPPLWPALQAERQRALEDKARNVAAEQAPLIVLAGLK
jgi:hypothetical protein